ncbi:MAG: xylulokinase [Planctomycetes bacterium]|nr:xylulokinase [Planctomycetota bacterium]MBI3846892.1 xylulokinase [Planctomycetota bacterium]
MRRDAGGGFTIGLDVGTTGARALLVDGRGRIRRRGSAGYPLDVPRPGFAEQDADRWTRASVLAVREAIGSSAASVRAIGLTGQMHGAVFLDAACRPIRPAILWCDQRSERECEEVERLVGSDRLRRVAGNPALAGFTAPKILWLRRHEPRAFARTHHVLLPKDFVRLSLTGKMQSDVSDASGTLLLDVPARRWSREILEALQIPASWLPEVRESPEPAAKLTESAAKRTGLRPGIPVVAGAGDCAAGAIATGIVEPGLLSLSIGTSGVLFADCARPTIDPRGRLHAFCHAVPNRWHLMGVMLMAGGSLRHLRDTVFPELRRRRDGGYPAIDRLAAGVDPGASSLLYLPYLCGERSPHKDPKARGAFVGLALHHGRAHLARAVLEGVAFAMRDSLEVFSQLGIAATRVRMTGGGARSAVWRQIFADVFDLPVDTVAADEGAAYGAALLAAVGAGTFPDVPSAVRSWVQARPGARPRPAIAAWYRETYGAFRDLYPSLRPSFERLASFSSTEAARDT